MKPKIDRKRELTSDNDLHLMFCAADPLHSLLELRI